ncbi:rod shape-determining protein MreD [Neisseria chenwenguii]|uniref:Rod shape-determining protein MreD n=2 Tax=Neisseria chenwenguii TaxID=1853278 RepID=A0A220S419_9NEIS|nr:rod shape-determining protein MreD [Neisseria chenwenguii]ROV57376.1 rod shape-determining protein MreD [Neisseria chenwenguii]
MDDYDDSSRAVSLRVVIISFILAMLLDFMPFPFDAFFWLPELTALVLVYWAIHRPKWVGLSAAFAVGLLADVGTASSLGLHALSYTVMVFFILRHHRQITLGHMIQILVVLAALMCNQAVLVVVRLFLNHQIITWQSFISPLVATLLWPIVSQLMLTATNFRRAYR